MIVLCGSRFPSWSITSRLGLPLTPGLGLPLTSGLRLLPVVRLLTWTCGVTWSEGFNFDFARFRTHIGGGLHLIATFWSGLWLGMGPPRIKSALLGAFSGGARPKTAWSVSSLCMRTSTGTLRAALIIWPRNITRRWFVDNKFTTTWGWFFNDDFAATRYRLA